MPYYLNPNISGITAANSNFTGTSITVRWTKAYPLIPNNRIAYNIYFNDQQTPDFTRDHFNQDPIFFSLDGYTSATIEDLTPGVMYHFGVRALEYDNTFDFTTLPIVYENLRTLPKSLLAYNLSTDDMIVYLADTEGFPSSGIIKIDTELLSYSTIDGYDGYEGLIITERGIGTTTAQEHTMDSGSYAIFWPFSNEEQNTRVYECEARFDLNQQKYLPTDGYHQKTADLLNTDMTVSDEINLNFPPYDFNQYHTDPRLVLSGDCIGSYIGGTRGCIDGYSGSFIIRGVSPVIQNQQRQEVLLNVDGEPCILVKKQWTGITCTCYIPTQEYPEARCNKCFTPETLVRTETGLRPIVDIKVGDKVLSSDGKYYPVSKVFKNEYKGKLQSIYSTTNSNPIFSTPEHPFMVLRGEHKKKIRCGPKCDNFILNGDGISDRFDIKETENGRWHGRATINYKRTVLGTFDTYDEAKLAIISFKEQNIGKNHELLWDEAKNIKAKDWLVPKWNKYIEDMETISIPDCFKKNTKFGSKRNGDSIFDVDEEFLWMIGLYLAEGCVGTRSICFALHKDETDYQNRIVNYFKSKGYNSKITLVPENGARVYVYGSSLPGWFKYMFGSKCYNKNLPEYFMRLPENKTRYIVDGVYCGDGSKTRREHEITQTSEILALQLVEMLHRLGKKPLLRKTQAETLTPKGNKRRIAYTVSQEEDDFWHSNRRGAWDFDGTLLSSVKEVKEIDYDGYVYNLEVGGDNTYVVQNILVHNCFGTGFIVGWQRYFNPRRSDRKIIVRFDPTVETVDPTESGLESNLKPNCWTLTVPTIHERDFIVRFDQAGNEEFRYEVINVTRNKFILDNTGLQRFTLQRIRKTDIIYQVPVLEDVNTNSDGSSGVNIFRTLSTSIEMSIGFPPHLHTIEVSDKTISPLQVNGITSIVQGHSHVVRNGQVLDGSEVPGEIGIGHNHSLLWVSP